MENHETPFLYLMIVFVIGIIIFLVKKNQSND